MGANSPTQGATPASLQRLPTAETENTITTAPNLREPPMESRANSTGDSRSLERQPTEPVLMETSEVASMLSMSKSWVYREVPNWA